MASTTARPTPIIVANVASLSREMVHQIIDDLPVGKILNMLSYGVAWLDICILCHPQYQEVFATLADLNTAKVLYELHHDICVHNEKQISPSSSVLSRNITRSPGGLTCAELCQYLHSKILNLLSIANPWMTLLQNYSNSTAPFASEVTVTSMRLKWEWVRSAEAALNNARSKQLKMAADLLESDTGRLILKRPLDPSQGGPRKNTDHIIKRLRADAKKILKDRIIGGRFTAKSIWAIPITSVIPYDNYLSFFMDMIKTFPPLETMVNIPQELIYASSSKRCLIKAGLSTMEEGEDRKPPKPFKYPIDIAIELGTVLQGMKYVYTSSTTARTFPIVDDPLNGKFTSEPTRFLVAKPTLSLNRPNHNNLSFWLDHNPPHDEREYTWLRAFLRVVSWMKENTV